MTWLETASRDLFRRRLWLPAVCLFVVAGCAAPQKTESAGAASKGGQATETKASPAQPAETKMSAAGSGKATGKPAGGQADVEKMNADELAEHIRKMAAEGGAKPAREERPAGAGAAAAKPAARASSGQEPERISRPAEQISPNAVHNRTETTGPAGTAAARPIEVPGPGGVESRERVGPTDIDRKPQNTGKGQDEAGCGGKGETDGLTPPPPDQPQPKYVCKENQITKEDVWKGERPEFVFTIANEGQGVLQVNLKGG